MSVNPFIYQELREFYFMRFLLVQIAKNYPCKRILCMVKLPLQCNERGIYMFLSRIHISSRKPRRRETQESGDLNYLYYFPLFIPYSKCKQ